MSSSGNRQIQWCTFFRIHILYAENLFEVPHFSLNTNQWKSEYTYQNVEKKSYPKMNIQEYREIRSYRLNIQENRKFLFVSFEYTGIQTYTYYLNEQEIQIRSYPLSIQEYSKGLILWIYRNRDKVLSFEYTRIHKRSHRLNIQEYS